MSHNKNIFIKMHSFAAILHLGAAVTQRNRIYVLRPLVLFTFSCLRKVGCLWKAFPTFVTIEYTGSFAVL